MGSEGHRSGLGSALRHHHDNGGRIRRSYGRVAGIEMAVRRADRPRYPIRVPRPFWLTRMGIEAGGPCIALAGDPGSTAGLAYGGHSLERRSTPVRNPCKTGLREGQHRLPQSDDTAKPLLHRRKSHAVHAVADSPACSEDVPCPDQDRDWSVLAFHTGGPRPLQRCERHSEPAHCPRHWREYGRPMAH